MQYADIFKIAKALELIDRKRSLTKASGSMSTNFINQNQKGRKSGAQHFD